MIPANPPSRAAIAALNNAAWCDSVCRAHGGATRFDASAWLNAAPGPRFFPNLVTLRAGAAPAVAVAVSLLDGKLGRQWSVKDSFADLDLQVHGFMPLFDAAWIWCGGSPREIAPPHCDALSWTAVASPAGLADWERGALSGVAAVHLRPRAAAGWAPGPGLRIRRAVARLGAQALISPGRAARSRWRPRPW